MLFLLVDTPEFLSQVLLLLLLKICAFLSSQCVNDCDSAESRAHRCYVWQRELIGCSVVLMLFRFLIIQHPKVPTNLVSLTVWWRCHIVLSLCFWNTFSQTISHMQILGWAQARLVLKSNDIRCSVVSHIWCLWLFRLFLPPKWFLKWGTHTR